LRSTSAHGFAALACAALLWLPSPASAFCRTTTCKGATCPTDDDGCPLAGKALWWRGGCIGYSLEAAGSRMIDKEALRQAVRRSFQTWSQISCPGGGFASITFAELPETPCDSAGFSPDGPNVNAVILQDDDWKFKEDNNVAKTSVHFDSATGEILDTDLEINTAVNLFSTVDKLVKGERYLDLQTVVTHEIGHMLGLAHSDRVDSVMFALYKGGLSGRKLTRDDIEALCAIYPPSRPASCDPTPRGGLSDCSGSAEAAMCQSSPRVQGGPWWMLGLATAALTWRSGYRRRAR
jgi:hypothetical protein